jgi:hypothetical protein
MQCQFAYWALLLLSVRRFNPTATPHWAYVADKLLELGLPAVDIAKPGLPAMHTVDEAIMLRDYVDDCSPPGGL